MARLALALILVLGAMAGARAAERFTGERCAALIRLFDRIVVTRYDHRLLGVEAWTLREAEDLRRDAAADCADGRIWFGVLAIEEALDRIHVPPAAGPDPD